MNKCRCLIADDHPVVRRGVRDVLEDEHLCSDIYEAKTGEEALEALRRQPWDLLILDIALPDKHGLDVLKEAKLLQPRLSVLMLSLYPEKEFAMRAIKAGASRQQWVSPSVYIMIRDATPIPSRAFQSHQFLRSLEKWR